MHLPAEEQGRGTTTDTEAIHQSPNKIYHLHSQNMLVPMIHNRMVIVKDGLYSARVSTDASPSP